MSREMGKAQKCAQGRNLQRESQGLKFTRGKHVTPLVDCCLPSTLPRRRTLKKGSSTRVGGYDGSGTPKP